VPVIDQCLNDKFALYHADCMEVLPTLPDRSIDVSVYSPPFPELYQYSDDPRDMTNCTSYDESIDQYRFVVREIARLTKPGRLSCVHCTDLRRGSLYQRDFPGDIVRVHEELGMHFFCRVTIWKDPWEFARRTRMKSLMHKTVSVVDSAQSRIAPPDYLLVFKKSGVNATPVKHEKGFRYYAGKTPIPPDLIKDYGHYEGDPRNNLLSHWIWRQYASPVWMDIRRKRIMPYQAARENPEERHVCPLQLDVIERCLILWSNPGETLLTPFAGVGSEVYSALLNCRKGIGVELKATYYRQALANLREVPEHHEQQDSFEVGEVEEQEESEDGAEALGGVV
jgi:DNA modification methylase